MLSCCWKEDEVSRRVLLPAEFLVIIFFLSSIGLHLLFRCPVRNSFPMYAGRVGQAVCLYAVGIFLCFFLTRLSHLKIQLKEKRLVPWEESWLEFRKKFLDSRRVLYDIRTVHAVIVMFITFLNLKHLVPVVNERIFDQLLLDFEKVVFWGGLAGEYLHKWLTPRSAQFVSESYLLFYEYTTLLVWCMVLQRNKEMSRMFFTHFVLVWLVGILIVYLLPTLGPCFFVPEVFGALPQTNTAVLQAKLWELRTALLSDPTHHAGVNLVSGLPSLHLAIPILGTVYLWYLHRGLSVLSGIFALLTFVATLYFGWHYLLDDIASVVLVYLVFKVAPFRIGEVVKK